MLKKPFFSIIIPALNEQDYLPKLLSDLAKQKAKNFEVIIVDSMSKDATRQRALKFVKDFPLEFCEVKKRNVSYQRNFGAQKAKGQFLLFLDSDARVNSTFTKDVYSGIFEEKGEIFLPVLITESRASKNIILFKLINSVIELSQSFEKPLSAGGSIFISRKLFIELGGFKERLYLSEDHNLVQRAKKLGAKAKILKDAHVTFSLRRVEREGEIMVLYKTLFSLIYMIVNGEVANRIFEYEMGGGKCKKVRLREKKGSFKGEAARLRRLLKKTSGFLIDSLS